MLFTHFHQKILTLACFLLILPAALAFPRRHQGRGTDKQISCYSGYFWISSLSAYLLGGADKQISRYSISTFRKMQHSYALHPFPSPKCDTPMLFTHFHQKIATLLCFLLILPAALAFPRRHQGRGADKQISCYSILPPPARRR